MKILRILLLAVSMCICIFALQQETKAQGGEVFCVFEEDGGGQLVCYFCPFNDEGTPGDTCFLIEIIIPPHPTPTPEPEPDPGPPWT